MLLTGFSKMCLGINYFSGVLAGHTSDGVAAHSDQRLREYAGLRSLAQRTTQGADWFSKILSASDPSSFSARITGGATRRRSPGEGG